MSFGLKVGRLELVEVNITFDPASWPFDERGTKELKLKCMRVINKEKWKQVRQWMLRESSGRHTIGNPFTDLSFAAV
jgi:hypothetical protein